jgi:hypothetical protein
LRIVETLRLWKSVVSHILKLLKLSPRCQSFSLFIGARSPCPLDTTVAHCN